MFYNELKNLFVNFKLSQKLQKYGKLKKSLSYFLVYMDLENKKLPDLWPDLSRDYWNSVSYFVYSEQVKNRVQWVLELSKKSRENSWFSKLVEKELMMKIDLDDHFKEIVSSWMKEFELSEADDFINKVKNWEIPEDEFLDKFLWFLNSQNLDWFDKILDFFS